MPSVESMPTAARPTPKTPSRNDPLSPEPPPAAWKDTRIATTMVSSGTHVEIIPSAMPEMMTVAGPVSAWWAIRRVGLCS